MHPIFLLARLAAASSSTGTIVTTSIVSFATGMVGLASFLFYKIRNLLQRVTTAEKKSNELLQTVSSSRQVTKELEKRAKTAEATVKQQDTTLTETKKELDDTKKELEKEKNELEKEKKENKKNRENATYMGIEMEAIKKKEGNRENMIQALMAQFGLLPQVQPLTSTGSVVATQLKH